MKCLPATPWQYDSATASATAPVEWTGDDDHVHEADDGPDGLAFDDPEVPRSYMSWPFRSICLVSSYNTFTKAAHWSISVYIDYVVLIVAWIGKQF